MYKNIACLLRVESLVLLNPRASDLSYLSEGCVSFLGPGRVVPRQPITRSIPKFSLLLHIHPNGSFALQ